MVEEYSYKELESMSDFEIKNHFLEIRSKIIFNKKNKINIKDLEIYYCYVANEIQNRN
jgi:hypothetical protein